MTSRYLLLVAGLLLLVSATVNGDILNRGFLISQVNQDADLTMEEVPRNITNPSDEVTLRWEPDVRGTLRYAQNFRGNAPQGYRNVLEDPDEAGRGFIRFEGRQLPVGFIYCIIDGGDEGHSAVFRMIRAAGNAPEMTAPITAAGRRGVNTVTPIFRWQPVEGAPYYHVFVSDQPFELNENEDGQMQVEGANLIWQAITSQNSIMYGIPDPSEFFESDNIPPLVGNTDRRDRPRYAWLVLNNFGNHPAYTSLITGGVSGFEVEVEPPFDEPENIAPEQGSNIAADDIIFRWSPVQEATSYFVYVMREEITPGGSQAFIPAWNAQTTNTSIECPAANSFENGRYMWKVLAASQQGRGTMSDTTSFNYALESGEVIFRTRTNEGNPLQFVEITTDPIEGAALLPISTDDNGYHEHSVPVGRYIFTAHKSGYEDARTEIVTIENEEEYRVNIELTPRPSAIVGTVINSDDETPISGATVTARNLQDRETEITETNISGEYQIDLYPGPWNISASAAGYERSNIVGIRVEAGHNYDINDEHGPFELEPYLFDVSGIVRNPAGQPIQLAEVTITREGDDIYERYTPEAGTYSFTIGVGNWMMNARKPGFYLESGPVPIRVVDRDIERNFTLVPQAGIISGQVTVDGAPADGDARVVFIPSAGEIITRQTNQIGGYSQGLAPGDYVVAPELERYHTEDSLEISIGPGETISGVRLALWANPSSISGRITDNDNQPLRDAAVSASGVSTQTNAQGNYTLILSAGNHVIRAQKENYVTAEEGPVAVDVDEDLQNVNLRLVANAGSISGSVRRGNEPIVDALVTAEDQDNDNRFTTRTDGQGNYSFGLRHGLYQLTVQRDGFVAAEPGIHRVQLQPGQRVTNRNFQMLNYSARIRGVVRSPAGNVSSPSVRVVQLGNPNRSYNTSGNVEGRFTVTVTPEVRYIVTVTKQGYSTDTDTTEQMEIEGEASLEFNIEALPCQISGRTMVNDAPLSRVIVRAEGDNGATEARSDGNGFYRLNLPAGNYWLSASKPGYVCEDIEIRLNPGENRQNIRFDLEENFALISGSVVESENENPVSDCHVTLTDQVSGRRTTQTTDQDGAFLFDRLLQGNYRLTANHPRFAENSLNVGAVVGGQERRRLVMTLDALESRLEGIVHADNQRIAGATVYARRNDEELSAMTNQNGEFTFAHVGRGDYSLLPTRAGYTGVELEDVEVPPGDTVSVELEMIANDGRITGRVLDPDNIGLREARISAFDELGNFASTQSAPSGNFTIENLYPLSEYIVTVQLNNYTAAEDSVSGVENGDNVVFRMTPNSLRISGRVANQLNEPLPGTPVSVVSLTDGSNFNATTDNNGNYTIQRLAANTGYRIRTHRYEDIYTNVDRVIETDVNHQQGVNLVIVESSAIILGNAEEREVSIEVRNMQTGNTSNVYTSANGNYQISRLREGNYVVKARKVGYRVTPDSIIVRDLELDEERENIDFTVNIIRVDISGRVFDNYDEPFANAPVLAWSQTGEARDSTDENGNFLFADLIPNQTYRLSTEMPREGYDNGFVDVEAEENDIPDVRLNVLRHNATVTGNVKSAAGRNLSDVGVVLDGNIDTLTNRDGNFTFEYLSGGNHTLEFSKSGYVSLERQIDAGNGEGEYSDVYELDPLTSALYGTITRTAAEEPLDDAQVELTDSDGNVETTVTGSDGLYTFNNRNLNLTYSITVSKKGFTSETMEDISVTENSREVNFSLDLNPSSISGCFRLATGEKIPNAPVLLRSFANTVMYDTTDRFGDFTFQVEPGSYMLLAEYPTRNLGTSYNENIALPVNESIYRCLRLSNTGVIKGLLITDEGAPPATSGKIIAQHIASGTLVFNWSRFDGSFIMRGMLPGNQAISVEAAGYATVEDNYTVDVSAGGDSTEVTIVLTQSGKAIDGTITDQDDNPVERVRVSILGPTEAEMYTAKDGYYSLADPESGEYTIAVARLGYQPPPDTTFQIEAGEIAEINRRMHRIPNAVSGKVSDEFGDPLENALIKLIDVEEAIDSTLTNEFGEYFISGIEAGDYRLTAEKENYESEPEFIEISISEGRSLFSKNFILSLITGFGNVEGIVMHGENPVAETVVRLRNLTFEEISRSETDENGEFRFSDLTAPSQYRIRVILAGGREATDSIFTLMKDSTVFREIRFPAGQITVTVRNAEGVPIVNRPFYIHGLTVDCDTTLFTDRNGYAETVDWLEAGDYSIVPASDPEELPPLPKTITLELDEKAELMWNIGLVYTPPPPFGYEDSARVEIKIPNALTVTEGNLFFKGPGKIEWDDRPLIPIGGVSSPISRSIRRAGVNSKTPDLDSPDQTTVYYAYIPPQRASGTLSYYLEVHTEEGITFGGPSTVREVQITREGMLDHLVLTRTMAAFGDIQIGVPVKINVEAYDDGNTNLTEDFTPEDIIWTDASETPLGALTTNPATPTEAIYDPQEPGDVSISVVFNQSESEVTIHDGLQWMNTFWLIDTLSIGPNDLEIASGDSGLFIVSAQDTSGASMPVKPIWITETENLGRISPKPYTLQAWFIAAPGKFGRVRIAVQDSVSGKLTYFNEGRDIAPSNRGLAVYALLTAEDTDTLTYTDGEGFSVSIPPGVITNSGQKLYLEKQSLPSVMRVSNETESSPIGYDLSFDGTRNQDAEVTVTLPIPEEFEMEKPLVGIWDPVIVDWNKVEGEFVTGENAVKVKTRRLNAMFTLLVESKPLNIGNLKFNPNPFSPEADGLSIEFNLESNAATDLVVNLHIYNMSGELIRTMIDGIQMPKGYYARNAPDEKNRIVWNGLTDSGRMARNGRYVVVLKAKDATGEVEKIGSAILIK